MLQEGKKKSKTKEEGDGSCYRLLREATLQRSFKRGRRRRWHALERITTTESPSSATL
jgi:hypothetical protein